MIASAELGGTDHHLPCPALSAGAAHPYVANSEYIMSLQAGLLWSVWGSWIHG